MIQAEKKPMAAAKNLEIGMVVSNTPIKNNGIERSDICEDIATADKDSGFDRDSAAIKLLTAFIISKSSSNIYQATIQAYKTADMMMKIRKLTTEDLKRSSCETIWAKEI